MKFKSSLWKFFLVSLIFFFLRLSSTYSFTPTSVPGNPSDYWSPTETISSPGSGAGYPDYGYNFPPQYNFSPAGPHGGYVSTTNKCRECHAVHRAYSSQVLLRYQTILANCRYCHDPTFGVTSETVAPRGWVYQVIPSSEIRGGHNLRMEVATSILGGSFSLDTTFTCTSCHSPHANPRRMITASFVGDSETTATNHLLLGTPGPATGVYFVYGGGWCADCHDRRHNGIPGINNHPVSTSTAYESVDYWDGTSYDTTALANSHAGYVMRDRSGIDDPNPICQQCHEDARDVPSATFSPGSNPSYVAFPHETANYRMVVETGDDLCLNCHLTSELP